MTALSADGRPLVRVPPNVLGDAINGPLTGSKLEPVTFVRTFWFSWAAFRPDTTLIES